MRLLPSSRTLFLFSIVATLGLLGTQPAAISALPARLVPRGFNGMGMASLALAVIDYLKHQNAYVSPASLISLPADAQDTQKAPTPQPVLTPQQDPSVPDKCVIRMLTISGGNCQTFIQCSQTDSIGTDLSAQWQVCYLGGRQYFHDDRVGDFSITWSQAGGVDGNTEDGLHHPILQLANIGDWDPLDVEENAQRSGSEGAGNLCAWWNSAAGTEQIGFGCGVPVVGTAGFGLSNYEPVQEQGSFEPGWCTMHVVQWQRNENGVGADYALDVEIFDNAKVKVGQVVKAGIDAATKTLSVTSQLPFTLDVTAAGDDQAAVGFAYGDQSWQSGDEGHQDTLGTGEEHGYENGKREGDARFQC